MPENHITVDTETLSSSWLSVLSDLFLILWFIVNAVLWCLWIYRIYKNLYAMNIPHLRQSPGLAVGWYFIPIACLWKPYEGIKDAWNACSTIGALVPGSKKLKVRWSLRAGGLFGFSPLFWASLPIGSKWEQILLVSWLWQRQYIFTSLIDIAVAIMAIQVVKKLTDQQEEKYQSLAVQQVPIAETTANNEPSFTFKQPEKNKPSSDFLWD